MIVLRDRTHGHAGRQRGAVLMIGMVMLFMLTLIAVAVIRLSMRHTQVVSNEQLRTEAVAAANYALDSVLNVPFQDCTVTPCVLNWIPYSGAGQAVSVNLGLNQTADANSTPVQVTVSNLNCKRGRVIKNSELIDPTTGFVKVAADKPCIFGGGGGHLVFGSGGGSAGNSLCANVLWEMRAQASDPQMLNAAVPITQGVEVRADIASYLNACP